MNINLKNRTSKIAKQLVVLGAFFFFASTTGFAQESSNPSNAGGSGPGQLRTYQYVEQRDFAMDVPAKWVAEDSTDWPDTTIAGYTSNEGGTHKVWVSRFLVSSEDVDAMAVLENNMKSAYQDLGFQNFVVTEPTFGSKMFALLEAELLSEDGGETRFLYAYHLKKGKHVYLVQFTTDNKDMLELFERMVSSIKVSVG